MIVEKRLETIDCLKKGKIHLSYNYNYRANLIDIDTIQYTYASFDSLSEIKSLKKGKINQIYKATFNEQNKPISENKGGFWGSNVNYFYEKDKTIVSAYADNHFLIDSSHYFYDKKGRIIEIIKFDVHKNVDVSSKVFMIYKNDLLVKSYELFDRTYIGWDTSMVEYYYYDKNKNIIKHSSENRFMADTTIESYTYSKDLRLSKSAIDKYYKDGSNLKLVYEYLYSKKLNNK